MGPSLGLIYQGLARGKQGLSLGPLHVRRPPISLGVGEEPSAFSLVFVIAAFLELLKRRRSGRLEGVGCRPWFGAGYRTPRLRQDSSRRIVPTASVTLPSLLYAHCAT